MTERQSAAFLDSARHYLLPDDAPAFLGLSPSEREIVAQGDANALLSIVERHLERNLVTMQVMGIAAVFILVGTLIAVMYIPGFVHTPAWVLFGMPLAWMLLAMAYAFRVALPRVQLLERAQGILLELTNPNAPDSTVVLVDHDDDLAA